jgi:uncharacterized protein (DUF1778 family)
VSKKLRVTRPIIKKFRVSQDESDLWDRAAELATEGNVSDFVRLAANEKAKRMEEAQRAARKRPRRATATAATGAA